MVKPEQFEVIFGNPRKVYRAGEAITGSLILHLNETQPHASLHLKFSGKAQVSFTRGSGRGKRHCWTKESYLKREVRLLPREDTPLLTTEGCNSGANTQLEQGHHEFPFIFNLPAGIPSSYECFSGGVRYCIKAKLEVGWKDSISIRQHFVVFQPYDLNDNGLARHPVEHQAETALCHLCCASGTLSARISIPRQGFVPGETIPVQADISNNTISRVRKIYFTIEEVSHCHAVGETETAYKTLTTLTPPEEQSSVAAGTSNSWAWQDMIMVPVAMPTGLNSCSVIDVEHRLVLNVIPVGPCCSLKVPVDIVIGTVPLASDQYSADDVISPPSYNTGYSNSHASSGTGSSYRSEIVGIQPPAYSPYMISPGTLPARQEPDNTLHTMNTQPTLDSSLAASNEKDPCM